MSASKEALLQRIKRALGAMAPEGPQDLRAFLERPALSEKSTAAEIEAMIRLILSRDANGPGRLCFSDLLRSWDNDKDAGWAGGTSRNTAARRGRIHLLLKSGADLERRIDKLLPFFRVDEPVVIAEKHKEWYAPQSGIRDYYWSTYVSYLRKRGWRDDSLTVLSNSTRAIVECLANPQAKVAYASRGLVMGYVQSGKTANFTGVVARAADAGYRLVIVLAGTWNILRDQTQRRFDKELLGKELLANDETYSDYPPSDWPEFLEHGKDPIQLPYTWQRLTRRNFDFRRLKAAIDNLEFEKRNKHAPLYDPSNLHEMPAKLLVIKKNSGILGHLYKDLKTLRTKLTDLPTLIVDDESDEAGLNTIDPRKRLADADKRRSMVNSRIRALLRLFPRGQYVGYTATPYANVLVDPDDPEDLFPKDFIVSLDRPHGYMGVSDFFDATSAYEDLDKNDHSQPEIAFLRRVNSPCDQDDEDLKKALSSYVLSGGVKLYRLSRDPERYRPGDLKHHTMLIHTSSRKNVMTLVAERLHHLWGQCAFNTPNGRTALEKLWNDDYAKVCASTGTELTPESFRSLVPHLADAIKRIEMGQRIFLVLNSDSTDAPDFSAGPVWKIVIGGNKLSRGYTVEGLTISYYRRVSGTAATLMQMGRWFGFRPGYRDLVRVFLGVKEGKKLDIDLVSLFKEVCRMEERFRDEVKRYVREPGVKPITPMQVPPMISVFGNLPPVARNKMFNAVMVSKNFGGQSSMPTLAPAKREAMLENVKAFRKMASVAKPLGTKSLGGFSKANGAIRAPVALFRASNVQLVRFLRAYQWLESDYKPGERPSEVSLVIEFLEKKAIGILSWLIVAPQRKLSFGAPVNVKAGYDLTVKERSRSGGRGFGGFGEPRHRIIAQFLAGIEPGIEDLEQPSQETRALQTRSQAVVLLYPVREQPEGLASIGFELYFPKNKLSRDIGFTVRRKAEKTRIIVQGPGKK